MRAKAGLGGVEAGAVLVAEQAVQPAIRVAAIAEIVDQLGMAWNLGDIVQVDTTLMIARQITEEALALQRSVRGEDVEADG